MRAAETVQLLLFENELACAPSPRRNQRALLEQCFDVVLIELKAGAAQNLAVFLKDPVVIANAVDAAAMPPTSAMPW